MIRVDPYVFYGDFTNNNDIDSFTLRIDGKDFVRGIDNSINTFENIETPGDGRWFKHTSDTISITLEGNGDTEGGFFGMWDLLGAYIDVYEPTITASGGGAMSEASPSTVTFTASRDEPAGYLGANFGDEPIPDTTVEASRGGTALMGADYEGNLPIASFTFSNGQTQKVFDVMVIDDDAAENNEGDTTTQESITWTVPTTNTALPTILTATIADDTSWFYSPWETVGPGPIDYDDVHFSQQYGSVAEGYTETYTQKFEWQAITELAAESPQFGEAAVLSGYIENQTSSTWGWQVGGDFDLSRFVKVPLTVSGSWQQSASTTNGVGKNVGKTQGGEPNTRYHIQAYALYSYIVVEKRHFEEEENPHGPHLPKVYVQVGSTTSSVEYLGFRGTEVSYLVRKQQRYWLDENSSQTQGKDRSLLPPPAAPTKIA